MSLLLYRTSSVERNVILKWKDKKKMKSIWMLIVHNAFFSVSIGPFCIPIRFRWMRAPFNRTFWTRIVRITKAIGFSPFYTRMVVACRRDKLQSIFSSTLRTLPWLVRGWNGKNKTKRFRNQRISTAKSGLFSGLFFFGFLSSFCAYHVSCRRLNCINCDSLYGNIILCYILKWIGCTFLSWMIKKKIHKYY